METVGARKLWSFRDGESEIQPDMSNKLIARSNGHEVKSYHELAKSVAELQFRNPDYILFFRGQREDYKSQRDGRSTIRPGIFRAPEGYKIASENLVRKRYERLKTYEEMLVKSYERSTFPGKQKVRRQRLLRWSLLQHYEACKTPLLDVTQSLRIGASFASIGNRSSEAFLMILAVPQLSGGITSSAEAGIQVVRLSSACPPSALRPHVQEGYLLGEYPEVAAAIETADVRFYELDFSQRLIAKLRFDPSPGNFWRQDSYPKVEESDLIPDMTSDPFAQFIENLKQEAPFDIHGDH